jgi:hypothetical protein
MKILDVTPITDTARFPVKKGTLQFIQDAHRESLAATIQALIGADVYNPAVAYVMSGCKNTGTFPNYIITGGAIFYNGEVFDIAPATFTASTGNVAVLSIVQTQYTTDADPVSFTDATTRNIHNIRKMQVLQGVSGSTISDYSAAVFLSFVIPQKLVLSAPTTIPYVGNQLQLIGAYPEQILYVPPASNLNPVIYAGSASWGDAVDGTPGGTDRAVTFPAVSTASYYVMGTVISNGTPSDDSDMAWTIRNRTTTGFIIHFREFAGTVQNVAFEFILFAK